ncbi:MAG TPA: hypothetical protein VMI54_21655 [Polyangiaceae bacterium]|nr:hypothetical protein [Polyangiaceae bacterium]
MKGWIAALILLPSAALIFASGCGSVAVTTPPDSSAKAGASSGGSSNDGSGARLGTGGTVNLGEGGANSNGCPSSCAALNADCGFVTDTLCGGVVQCGDCPDGQTCGASTPSQCGDGTAGTSSGGSGGMGNCTPSSCDDLNANCGFATDTKCGGVVDCGTCPDGQTCGFAGPNQCGDNSGGGDCVVDPSTTCDGRGATCGHVADNCGNDLDCGSTQCPVAGQSCIQNVCNTPSCVVDPTTTCAGRGFTCGQAADNCGHLLDCGPTTCDIPGWTCGGGVDGSGNPVLGQCGCTGECSKVPTCPSGTTTTLKGVVYDPAGNNPLYRVLVYVANDPTDPDLKSFPKGLTCDVCGASAAGSPLVSDPTVTDPPAGTYTDVDGSFELKNVPVDKNVTLVIQLGRWRRVFQVDIDNACDENDVDAGLLRMPSTQADGNIPLMAMVTGNSDSLECVLRKMGIGSSEFTDPGADNTDVGTGAGRVQFYLGSDAKADTGVHGQKIDANTPYQAQLFQAGANGDPVLNEYDMTILACEGGGYAQAASDQAAVRAYADAGGRVFTTHYSYEWLYQNNANSAAAAGTADNWSEVAKWHVDENDRADTATGIIDKVSNPKGDAFQGWLEAVNASTPGSGQVNVVVIRHDVDAISSVEGQTQQWLYRIGTNAKKCGVSGGTCNSNSDCTPKVCNDSTTTACNSNTDCTNNYCKAKTTTSCTKNSDCGNGDTCVTDNTCKTNTCGGTDYTGQHLPLHFTFNTPVNLTQDLTATPPVVQCGRVLFSDFHVQDANEVNETYPQQCGKACKADSDCTGACTGGKCPWGAACTTKADCASKCSDDGYCLDPMNPQEKLLEYMIFDLGSCVPPPKACVPSTTCPDGQDCGYAPDGCNGLIPCGVCPDGEQCGVGQPPVPNHCGSISCTPDSACPADQECGYASDGCNGVINCGDCPAGQTCQNGKCGSGSCDPKSCAQQGIECGQAGDECGNQIQCPACPANETCINGKCVPQSCQPQSCADQSIECGSAADGCGNKIDSCGVCSAGSLCVSGMCVPIR